MSSGPGPARLILESGLGKIEYPLDAPVVTIGRSRSNDISLEDSRVSRHHARIVRDARGFIIEDLNSRNGTRVDDRAVRDSTTLSDGSVVRIGDSVFRFTMALQSAQPPPPSPGPNPWGGQGGYGPSGGHGGPPAPEVFVSPWSPVQCPNCQGLKTMRPIVYGPAAQSPGAQAAAHRGEVTLGDGPQRPDGPNAECRACGTRVRIVNTGG
jgi:pSer/pThr/pTyr-binding forkhead associated (FHA) protein